MNNRGGGSGGVYIVIHVFRVIVVFFFSCRCRRTRVMGIFCNAGRRTLLYIEALARASRRFIGLWMAGKSVFDLPPAEEFSVWLLCEINFFLRLPYRVARAASL